MSATDLPKVGTFSRLLFDLIKFRPGVSTRQLEEAVESSNAYVNSCVNMSQRRGLVENRSTTRSMGRWYLTELGEAKFEEEAKERRKKARRA